VSLIEIHDLHVHFLTEGGVVTALRGVNLALDKGEMLGLVGETGCGKSVTGLAMLGLVPPPGRIVRGQILLDGQDLATMGREELRRIRGRRIGAVFQDPQAALNPVFTIGEQLEVTLRTHLTLSRSETKARVRELLSDVGLPEVDRIVESYPHQISGGMQQRAMIALALACDPDLLIADEPTTALDVTIQQQILELLVDLQRRRNISVLLITHDLAVVAETTQRVAVLYAGRVVEEGPTRVVLGDAKHPYTQGVLGALPAPERRGKGLVAIPGAVPTGLNAITGCSFAPRCPHVMDHCWTVDPPAFPVGAEQFAECLLYEAGR
jgi:oligopeptide/dipeptide ABC transporter ATP-binding protein